MSTTKYKCTLVHVGFALAMVVLPITGTFAWAGEQPKLVLQLTVGAGVDASTEIDPTQRAAKVDGRSPNNILSSTFSDEMAIHFAGRSKLFAVSVSRPVTPYDIVPTLAAYLGMKPPSGAIGMPLPEVMGK